MDALEHGVKAVRKDGAPELAHVEIRLTFAMYFSRAPFGTCSQHQGFFLIDRSPTGLSTRRKHTPFTTRPLDMYDNAALSAMKLPELKEIAKKLGLKKAELLKKQDLVDKILEAQGAKPAAEKPIGPSFVGDDKDLTALATADEVPDEEDPEPEEALANGDGDEEENDDDEENGDEENGEDEEEISPVEQQRAVLQTPPQVERKDERERPDDRREPAPNDRPMGERREGDQRQRNDRPDGQRGDRQGDQRQDRGDRGDRNFRDDRRDQRGDRPQGQSNEGRQDQRGDQQRGDQQRSDQQRGDQQRGDQQRNDPQRQDRGFQDRQPPREQFNFDAFVE